MNEIDKGLYEKFLDAKVNKQKANEEYEKAREEIIALAGDFRKVKTMYLHGRSVLKIKKCERHVFYPSRLRQEYPVLYKQFADKKESCSIVEVKSNALSPEKTEEIARKSLLYFSGQAHPEIVFFYDGLVDGWTLPEKAARTVLNYMFDNQFIFATHVDERKIVGTKEQVEKIDCDSRKQSD